MPELTTLDSPAQQPHPGAEYQLHTGLIQKNLPKRDQRAERRGEVRVHEADEVRSIAYVRDTSSDSFRLAAVALEVEHLDALRSTERERTQDVERLVPAAVVDEEQRERLLGVEKLDVALRGQAASLVVARDDNDGFHRPRTPPYRAAGRNREGALHDVRDGVATLWQAGAMSQELFTRVRDALREDDPHGALRALRSGTRYPSEFDEAAWVTVFELVLGIGEALGDDSDLGPALVAGLESPGDAKVLYDVGYQLIEVGLPDLAAGILGHALEMRPGDPAIVTELCCALEDDLRFPDARAVLEAFPELWEEATMARYLLTFHRFMTADVDGARELLDALLRAEEELADTARQVQDMVTRADAIRGQAALDPSDLRGWHFAVNGTLLLHESPHGRDAGMNGRYAWVQDQETLCRSGIDLAKMALDALGMELPRVYLLGDRDSEILGRAAAEVWGLPAEPWPGDGAGIIVAYDLSLLDEATWRQVAEHRPGQVLWGHASQWTVRHAYGADLVTYLYQENTPPWGARLVVDPETQQALDVGPDESPAEEIARRVADAEADNSDQDTDALVALVKAATGARGRCAALRDSGRRRRQWCGSPVHSGRFL